MKPKAATNQPISHPRRRPMPQQRRGQPDQPARLYPVSLREFQQLLAAVGNDAVANNLRQIAAIVFYTGIRPGELKSLTWSNVDMEKCSMRVGSKSGKQRTVPFGHEVLQILVDRAKANAGAQYVLGKSPSAILHRISRRVQALPRTTDGRKLTLYSLRHSFALRWVNAGGSLVALMVMMGFSGHHPLKTFLSQVQAFVGAARFQSQLEDQEAI